MIIIISVILEGLLTNYLSYMPMNLTIFTSSLTITAIFVAYLKYNNKKKYCFFCIIAGILYDLLYTNILFLHSIVFLILAILTIKIYERFEINKISIILWTILIIIIYETIISISFYILGITQLNTLNIIYKISHTILLNITYAEIGYLLNKKKLLKNYFLHNIDKGDSYGRCQNRKKISIKKASKIIF